MSTTTQTEKKDTVPSGAPALTRQPSIEDQVRFPLLARISMIHALFN